MTLLTQQQRASSNQRILELVLNEEELSWQQIIYDLVRSEEMDPWNIDVSHISSKFMDVIRELHETDFRTSGKLVLAAALLVKIKSDRLLRDDLTALDDLINSGEEYGDQEWMMLDIEEYSTAGVEPEKPPKIYPRTPQPRKRKVSVYDLVTALEHALDQSLRKQARALDRVEITQVQIPDKQIDVTDAMNSLLKRIHQHHEDSGAVHFHQLLEAKEKKTVVLTFIPLLHLTNERRVDLHQPEAFKKIHIKLLDSTPVQDRQEEELILA